MNKIRRYIDQLKSDMSHVRFFKICLYVFVPLLLVEVISDFDRPVFLIVDLMALVVTLAAIVLLKYRQSFVLISFFYALTWFGVFVFIWLSAGGINGVAPYLFFAVMVLNIAILSRNLSIYFTSGIGLTCMFLSIYYPDGVIFTSIVPMEMTRNHLAYYYLISAAIISMAIIMLKTKMDNERKADIYTARKLTKLNNQLISKRAMYTYQQNELSNIQNDLEKVIRDRTLELEYRNKQLEKYAYDNAHHLRGPLCNISGVIELLKKENEASEFHSDWQDMGHQVEKLDLLIRRVNGILK